MSRVKEPPAQYNPRPGGSYSPEEHLRAQREALTPKELEAANDAAGVDTDEDTDEDEPTEPTQPPTPEPAHAGGY